MAIEVLNKQRWISIEVRRVADLTSATLALVQKRAKPAGASTQRGASASSQNESNAGAQVTVVFVRDRRIRELNRRFRNKDYPTDVLSFPAGGEPDEAPGLSEEHYLGDIVISTETAMRQAKEAKQTFEREIEELVIHGVLHLCGYNHETDNGEMNRLELKLRKRLLD